IGGTLLQEAASKGDVRIVELLLEKGVDVNAQGGLALRLRGGVKNGHTAIVRLLLERGADLYLNEVGNSTVWEAAVAKGRKEILQVLLEHAAGLNGREGIELQGTARKGHFTIEQHSLEEGFAVDQDKALRAVSINANERVARWL